jgi:hypothetical protein
VGENKSVECGREPEIGGLAGEVYTSDMAGKVKGWRTGRTERLAIDGLDDGLRITSFVTFVMRSDVYEFDNRCDRKSIQGGFDINLKFDIIAYRF